MDVMSAVSETALITLMARVVESEKDNPVIRDEMGSECLERLRTHLPTDTRNTGCIVCHSRSKSGYI